MSEFPISSARARPRREPRRTWPWLVAAIVITAIWSFALSVRPLDDVFFEDQGGAAGAAAYVLGTIVGSAIFVGGLVWLLLYFGFTRRLAPARGPAHFLALALTAALAATPLNALKIVGLANYLGTAPVRVVLGDYTARRDALGAEIRRERDAIVDGGFMEPAALARPGGLGEARRQLAALRKLAAEAPSRLDREAALARARVAEAASPGQRKRILAEFDAGYAEARATNAQDAALSAEAFDAMEGQLDVLSRTPRAWRPDGDAFGFTRDADLAAFNAHAAKLNTAIARAEALSKERAAAAAAEDNPQA